MPALSSCLGEEYGSAARHHMLGQRQAYRFAQRDGFAVASANAAASIVPWHSCNANALMLPHQLRSL